MSTGLTSMRSMLASSTVHEDSVRKIRFTRRLGAADLAGLSGFDVTCHQLHEWVPKELAESGEVEPTLEALRILDDPGANAAAALVRRRGGVTGSPRPSVPLPGVARTTQPFLRVCPGPATLLATPPTTAPTRPKEGLRDRAA